MSEPLEFELTMEHMLNLHQLETDLHQLITEYLQSLIRAYLDDLFQIPVIKEHLDYEQLIQSVPYPTIKLDREPHRCLGRISGGLRCSRKRHEESDYCGLHQDEHPYGQINQPWFPVYTPEHRIRTGRTGRVGMTGRPNGPNGRYIPFELISLDGQDYYYHESSGVLVEHRAPYGIVGRVSGDQVSWYHEEVGRPDSPLSPSLLSPPYGSIGDN